VMKFRLNNLTAKYPDLLPFTSWFNAFDLPQDVTAIGTKQLQQNGLFEKDHNGWSRRAGPAKTIPQPGLESKAHVRL
jgi:hypothetical protein